MQLVCTWMFKSLIFQLNYISHEYLPKEPIEIWSVVNQFRLNESISDKFG